MRKVLMALLAASSLTASAQLTADTGYGIGITYVFGSGVAVGVKVFEDDEETETTASLGMDYLIGSGAWRPNIGAAYLGDKNYADFTVGWNLKTGMVDFGLGGGYADTEEDNKITCPVGFTLIGSTCFMNT